MASSSRKNNETMLFKSKKPCFFKIILLDSINQQKLRIPRKFVKTYGDRLSSPVTLKVPTGAKWLVEIVKSTDGDIWFQNGWPEFAEYFSVTLGSFVVFEYEQRDCDFSVTIFDTSATEIDYPFSSKQEQNVDDEAEDDVSVEILDRFSPSGKTKAKSPMTLPPRPNKKKKLEISAYVEGSDNIESKKENGSSAGQKQTVIRRASSISQSENPSFRIKMHPSDVQCIRERVPKPSFPNSTKAIEDAKKFTSGNPFFQVLMTTSYLKGDRVHVPRDFMKKLKARTQRAKLLVDNRIWYVKLLDYPQHGKGELSQGWNGFARQNRLKVGDVCCFELIDSQELLIKVSISREGCVY